MKQFNNLTLATKMNVLVISILVVFSVVLGLVVQHLVTDGVKESAVEKAKSDLYLSYQALEERYPGQWSITDGSLYKGSVKVNDHFEMVDYIAGMTNGNVTIFQGDTRVSTNVLIDGNRAVGTQASDSVKETVLDGGNYYFGEANVAGLMNQTAYQPLQMQMAPLLVCTL
ncbi:cache domain-containing protein [Halalkalibacter akibai]|uniref:Methyl-accepting chemotaxis protein n=1 Tax=Halalkalibacter akibai (strain ATCC 43226 / DSM 21942 / CIP 109018 / JCM 9157 / 1139) TaxID=1236973 RepID=W4QNP1_HALA3|nr:cache domain-containing protein [Halalkalibacter akibai]GAE33288.1 methyl-accepting chemotaxis protein [Halalkalibacter akibai JCM 9157]